MNPALGDRIPYTEEWGELRYERLLEMLAVEIESVPYRLSRASEPRDRALREAVYHSNIQSVIAAHPQEKIAVNGGSAHTRKRTFGIIPEVNTGERLAGEHGQDLHSFAFAPLKGTLRTNPVGSETVQYDMTTTDPDNLLRIIAEIAGDKMSLLPLGHPRFTAGVKCQIPVDEQILGYNLPPVLPLGAVYDALITYPNASILESLQSH